MEKLIRPLGAVAAFIMIAHTAVAQDTAEEAIQRLRADYLYVGISAIIPENHVSGASEYTEAVETLRPLQPARHWSARTSGVNGTDLASSYSARAASQGEMRLASANSGYDYIVGPSLPDMFTTPSRPLPDAADPTVVPDIPAVPVPASLVLLGSAIAFAAGLSRRKRT